MNYEHTQRAWQNTAIGLTVAGALLVGAWLARGEACVVAINLAVAATFVAVAFMFGSLTVRDEGECLALRYGPLRVFRKRIPYADMTSVEPDRTKLIDGWGIHCIPGRGWTYNVWGFGCVKLTVGRTVVRVGTDDVEGLTRFLRGRLEGN